MDTGNYSKVEVLGQSLIAYVQAFRQYPTVLEKYFERFGLGNPNDPATLADWLPLEPWLRVTHGIVREVGSSSGYSIGKRVPEISTVPPEIDSLAALLRSIDIVYHLHHRVDGKPMFDPATGAMTDGIGHIRCEMTGGDSSAHVTSDTPYPCDLERGILAGFGARFEPAVSVTHVGDACRKKGDSTCTYLVQW